MEAVGRLEGDETIISKRAIESVKKEIEKIAIKYKNEIKVKYSITENKKYTTEECCQECPAINKFLYIINGGQFARIITFIEDRKGFLLFQNAP